MTAPMSPSPGRRASQMPGARRIGRRLTAAGPKRILAIDGGGTRGIVAIRFLAEIERTLQKKLGRGDDFVLSDYFDLVGGTSVGALIATLVARGWRVSDIEALFTAFAHDIFRSRTRRFASWIEARTGWRLRWLAKARDWGRIAVNLDTFSERKLVERIRAIVGDEPLASDKLRTGLVILCKRADTNSVWTFVNNPHAKYFDDRETTHEDGRKTKTIGNGHYVLADVLQASTAAPTIFKPVDIEIHDARDGTIVPIGRNDPKHGATGAGSFIDGGVSPHNSPALQMFLMAALSKYNLGGPDTPWRVRPNALLLVSVGTGAFETPVEGWYLPFRAVSALTGMIKDSEQFGLTVLQALSEPRNAWWIDGDVGDLKESTIGGLRGLSFQRFDLPIETKWLEEGNARKGIARGHAAGIAALRYPWSIKADVPLLQDMAAPEVIDRLGHLATATARDQVDASDFPEAFDRIWTEPDPGPRDSDVGVRPPPSVQAPMTSPEAATWTWQMLDNDTRDRMASTLAAMHALERAHKDAGSWKPSRVAAKLPGDAKALADILTSPAIAKLEEEQEAKSRSANRLRSRYSRLLLAVVAISAIGASLGGFALMKDVTWAGRPDPATLAGIQFGLLFFAALLWATLWLSRPHRGWLNDRGDSEGLRRQIFARVLDEADATSRAGAGDASSDAVANIRQLAFEYARVGMLDDQISWFLGKSKRATLQTLLIGAVRLIGFLVMALAMCMSGSTLFIPRSPLLGELLSTLPSWFADQDVAAFLAIIGTTMLTAAQAADAALLSGRNRARYRDMAQTLITFRGEQLAAAQAAARARAPASGADEARLFFQRVEHVLAIEHGEWRAVLDNNTRNIDGLRRQLSGDG